MSQNLELITTENQAQWLTVSNITPQIQKKEIKPFVKLALKILEGSPDSRTWNVPSLDKFAAVKAVVKHFTWLRSAGKGMWTSDDVHAFLEGIRFTPECVEELSTLLCMEVLYKNIPTHVQIAPKLVNLSWRIDVSLSQKSIQEENASKQISKEIVHRHTYIILIFKMADNTTRCHRINVQKFHELRYVLATVLKNIIILEKRKSIKHS